MIGRVARAPRIAVVGARRQRQGLGGYIAGHLHALGAQVVAVAGTRAETAQIAADQLQARYGMHVRPYGRLADLMAREDFDALVIASPPEHHLECLAAALAAGKHVLCEKPFIWHGNAPVGSRDIVARLEELEQAYRQRGLLLWENVQWPYVLDSFLELHPGAYGPDRPVTHFEMLMCPAASGAHMLVDSFSHVASVLCALDAPCTPVLEALRYRKGPEPVQMLDVNAVYRGERAAIEVACRLLRVDAPPRPASLAINGLVAYRLISEPGYRMQLAAEPEGRAGRVVPLRDPLVALLEDFVGAVSRCVMGRAAVFDPWLVARLEMLEQVVDMYPREAGDGE